MNKIIISFLILVVTASLFSCSGRLGVLIPDILGEKGEARLQKRLKQDEATALFKSGPELLHLLSEFVPSGINAGTYDARGIKVNLGLARCASADDAYGIYSGLTAGPRDRWRTPHGEMSYKSPYFAGCSGEYVFWFYSPSNPMSYYAFYRKHGEILLDQFVKLRKANSLSYHSSILPKENRFIDSMFYVRSRMVDDLNISNAYAATYLIKKNNATMYVMKYDTKKKADKKMSEYYGILQKSHKKIYEYTPIPGAPTRAFYWEEQSGVQILCQYRWLIFYLKDMSDPDYASGFIKIMFQNMRKIKNDLVRKEKS